MPNIFKVDIANEINKRLGPLVFPITLIKSRPSTRAELTGGVHSVKTIYRARGFTDSYNSNLIDGKTIRIGDMIVVILGGSTSAVPKAGDTVIVEGASLEVVSVVRDPAGATYECQAR